MDSRNASRTFVYRLLISLSLLLLLLPLAAYWLSPWWAPTLVDRLLQSQDLTLEQLELRRPGWDQLQIDRARVVRDGLRVEVSRLTIGFHWRNLLRGQLRQVSVGRLELRIDKTRRPDASQSEPERTGLRQLPEPPIPAHWLERLPWQASRIDAFELALPEYAIRVTGKAQQQSIEFDVEARLVAETPTMNRTLRVTHDADGVLSLQVASLNGDNPALQLILRFGQGTLNYALTSRPGQADTALLLSLLGYPPISADVELALGGEVPWPLPPDFTPQDLMLSGRYGFNMEDAGALLEPGSGFESLSLADWSGTFALAGDTLKVKANSGRVGFSQSGTTSVGRCTIAEALELSATRGALNVGKGVACQLKGDRGAIDLHLSGLDYRWPWSEGSQVAAELALKLTYAAAIDRLRPRGELQLQVYQDTDSTVSGAGTLGLSESRLIAAVETAGATAIPFTFRLWPEDERGELRFEHNLKLAERVLAAIDEEWSEGLDLGHARLRYLGTLSWQPDDLNLSVQGQFTALKIHQPEDTPASTLDLKPLAGRFSASVSDTTVQLEGQLRPGAFTLPVSLDYDLRRRRGQVTAAIKETLTASTLNQLFTNWPKSYALTGGQLSGDVSLTLADWAPLQLTGTVNLEAGTANYEDYRLSGIDTELDLKWEPERLLASSNRLQVRRIDLGFPVTEFSSGGSYEATTERSALRFDAIEAQLLGGTAESAGFTLDLNAPQSAFSVQLSGISLAELVALEGEEVSGTGILDGLLPIELGDDGLQVRNGTLTARPPGGVIRLSERFATPTGEPGLDFALTALSDFTYDALTASVDYTPDGALTLGVRLQGRNPNVERGRQINYNVNVTENVPALLQSLKADRLITDEVERRVNQ